MMPPTRRYAGEPFIDPDADESVAKQGWAAIRHAVKGTKAQKLGGVVSAASQEGRREPGGRPEHHISQALTDAKREHAAHLLKIADLEDELRVSRLNVTPEGDSAGEVGVHGGHEPVPPAPSPRGPPAPPTPPPPVHRTPGSPATPRRPRVSCPSPSTLPNSSVLIFLLQKVACWVARLARTPSSAD